MTSNSHALTVGTCGVPTPTMHALAAVPLLNPGDRWRYVNWEVVARGTEERQAVSFPCEPDEVDAALLAYNVFLLERDHHHPFETVYDPESRRLWLWSACFDLADHVRIGETPEAPSPPETIDGVMADLMNMDGPAS